MVRVLILVATILVTVLAGCGSGGGTAESASAPAHVALRNGDSQAQATRTVSLRAGWNGVAFEGFPLLTLTGSASVPGLVTWDGSAYQLGSLTAADVNAAGGANRGFWVFATGSTSFSYSATDVSGTSFNLKTGWNFVGFPARQLTSGASLVTRSGGQVVPIGSVLLTEFQRVNEDGTFTPVDMAGGGSITPGRPYWVFAASDVNVSWGVVTPGPSPTPTASSSPSPGSSPTPKASPSPGSSPTPSVSPGQGAPPNGVYNLEKIDGSILVGLGKLEISGMTYRGVELTGPFSSYTLDANNNMNLSAGLNGLPTGWTIRYASYLGVDSFLKKPLIKIYYFSERGTPDIIDAVLD